MFIIYDDRQWDNIKVGNLVRNITFYNNPGEANTYKIIPGLTRVSSKRFVPVDASGAASYKGKTYLLDIPIEKIGTSRRGAKGFYLYETVDPVLIEPDNDTEAEYANCIMR